MKRTIALSILVILLTLFLSVFFISGCGGGTGDRDLSTWTEPDSSTATPTGIPTISPTVNPSSTPAPPIAEGEWTILVYLASDNNLEYFGYLDMKEMEQAGSDENVRILVQWDRLGNHGSQDWKGTRRYYVLKDTGGSSDIVSRMLQDMGDVNSGSPQTLTDFIQWGVENYPARKYALILWNHGGGWKKGEIETQRGICWDDTSDDYITQAELRQVLSQVTGNMGKRFELIGMDACIMAAVEVAYDIRYYGNFITFSEANEAAHGWEYYSFLRDLKEDPSMNGALLGTAIVEGFAEFYRDDKRATLSTVTLSKMDSLAEAIQQLSNEAIADMGSVKADLRNCINNTQAPAYKNKDLGDFCDRIIQSVDSVNVKSSAQNVKEKLQAAVVSSHSGGSYGRCQGLTIWLPDIQEFNYYTNAYGSLEFGKNTSWRQFLESVLND